MDLETENRIAAILMKEAAEMQRQAQEDGVLAYLRQPKVRGRPNSRFLTATVLGVQQANRAAEVNELWRAREKELELNDKLNRRSKDQSRRSRSDGDSSISSRGTRKRYPEEEDNACTSYYLSKVVSENGFSREEGLRDEEIEEFLHSRVKRGRGAVGSRMDETGPYLPPSPSYEDGLSASPNVGEHRVLGPEKPSSLKSSESSDEEHQEERRKKAKKSHSRSSDKKHSKKHKNKEKSRDKKKKRKGEKKRKQH